MAALDTTHSIDEQSLTSADSRVEELDNTS